MFNKKLEVAQAGDNVGCLLRGIEKADIERGQVLAAPGTIKPHTKFEGQVYVLTPEEGGRHAPRCKSVTLDVTKLLAGDYPGGK